MTVGFSQVFYECIHMQLHKGNADRPNENGETVDWISIYKHGHDGDAEHPLKYTFLSFFREDPKTVYRELKRKNPRDAFWGVTELTLSRPRRRRADSCVSIPDRPFLGLRGRNSGKCT